MKRNFLLCLTALLLALIANVQAKKVHTLGDSTMAPYDENTTVTRGWGMYFGNFLTNGWTSQNYARGGRDSRGGYNELWQTAKSKVEAGDYVIIQFGHNDEKFGGADNSELVTYYNSIGNTDKANEVKKDGRGTFPSTTYKEWLGKIVDEVKAAGAHPILVAPVCRSYFSSGKIRRNGRHDLGDNYTAIVDGVLKEGLSVPATDHLMDYPYHMQQLAQEKQVPFIDLTTATAELYESYGDAKCHEFLFDGDGSTHFNTTGALLVARKCAELMKAQGILTEDITLPTDLSVSPAEADLGEAYKGQTLQKEFTLNGFGLQPESGTIKITAADGITLSLDKKEWSTELSVDYSASTLVKTFYAQLTLTKDGEQGGIISVKQGDKTIEVPVKATAVVLEGGADVKLSWLLEKDDSYELIGPATPIAETWEGMKVQSYNEPKGGATTWPEGTAVTNRKTQRNVIDNANTTWPANEIDDNPGRYIDFGIKANQGTTLKLNNISLYVGGAGGNGMMCHIYYSTDNFETRTTIYAPSKMVSNTMNEVSVQPVISLAPGQELHLRVYPWYNGSASGKTICLSQVVLSGVAVDATDGIHKKKNAYVVSTSYYTADGKKLEQPQHGMNIVCRKLADGTTDTSKKIY